MSWRIRWAALRGMSVARARSRMPHSPDSAKASRTRTQRAIGPLGEPPAVTGGSGGTVSTVAGSRVRWSSGRLTRSGCAWHMSIAAKWDPRPDIRDDDGTAAASADSANEGGDPRWRSATRFAQRASARGPHGRARAGATDTATLDAIANRILWLAVRMIHEANHVRPSTDGLKVGGHQASSASVVSILTALYFRWLRAGDLVAVKPHASPAYHALQYLLGNLDAAMLTRLRAFGGLQSYPSRTKDPDPRRLLDRLGRARRRRAAVRRPGRPLPAAPLPRVDASQPARRFVAIVGDAELDEGNVWEAILEEGAGRARQRDADRRPQPPEPRPGRARASASAASRAVRRGRLAGPRGQVRAPLQERFARPGGDALRERIDDMENEEYQVLIRRPGRGAARAARSTARRRHDRDGLARIVARRPRRRPAGAARRPRRPRPRRARARLPRGRRRDAPARRSSSPTPSRAGGCRSPATPQPLGPCSPPSSRAAGPRPRRRPRRRVGGLRAGLARGPPGRRRRAHRLGYDAPRPRRSRRRRRRPIADAATSGSLPRTSTQQASATRSRRSRRDPALGGRIVTAAPDVAVSTNLGGWINRVGVFAADAGPDRRRRPAAAASGSPGPAGQHIELGISEMNLFLWLSQFGPDRRAVRRAADAHRHGLRPVHRARPRRADLRALRRVAVHPRRHAVRRDAGAGGRRAPVDDHPLARHRAAGLRGYEPAFAREVAWCLLEGIRGCVDRTTGSRPTCGSRPGRSTSRSPRRSRRGSGEDDWRDAVLAGGYRLLEAAERPTRCPPAPGRARSSPRARSCPRRSTRSGSSIARRSRPNLIVVTSAERLAAEPARRPARRRAPRPARRRWRTSSRCSRRRSDARPIVTVADGASHALSFLGGVFGAPVVPLGVDKFGQSGTIPDLYAALASTPTTSSRRRCSRLTWRRTDGRRHQGHVDRGPDRRSSASGRTPSSPRSCTTAGRS